MSEIIEARAFELFLRLHGPDSIIIFEHVSFLRPSYNTITVFLSSLAKLSFLQSSPVLRWLLKPHDREIYSAIMHLGILASQVN